MGQKNEIGKPGDGSGPGPAKASGPDIGYRIRFRPQGQEYHALAHIRNLKVGDTVMLQTAQGLEPACILGSGPPRMAKKPGKQGVSHTIVRRASRDETTKYGRLIDREKEAFILCQQFIAEHRLQMKLIRVERFFNGSKIIFYFTAENRVDFRELVKRLVQQFRTRVEMRQIGVRHETKMIGGLGCCGRELCCSSFIKNFWPVSIKMAKEQGLPLNPAKISGICNRLLCCLTYEFKTYHAMRKKMPKIGKSLKLKGKTCKVLQLHPLEETITVTDPQNPDKHIVLNRNEWETAKKKS